MVDDELPSAQHGILLRGRCRGRGFLRGRRLHSFVNRRRRCSEGASGDNCEQHRETTTNTTLRRQT
jgi:hypothetical protein